MESFQKRERDRRKLQKRTAKDAQRKARAEARRLETAPPAPAYVAAETPKLIEPESGVLP